MLFSTITLVLIALVSLFSFLLLVETKMVIPGSFGGTRMCSSFLNDTLNKGSLDIGGAVYGQWMRRAILFSIIISQLGFVAAYTIFVAENLQVCTARPLFVKQNLDRPYTAGICDVCHQMQDPDPCSLSHLLPAHRLPPSRVDTEPC